MVELFENKIKNWNYRLLSLGGRVVLIKAVLTGLPVYWFSLERCPKSILNLLRRAIFSFLWGSSEDHQKIHLVCWKTVSAPIEYGGWDIKNLELFGISLRLKSMWQLLMGNGISSRIITHKYIKNIPLVEWIRARKFNVSGTSYFWNGFIRIVSWITGQLGWKVGNGSNIRLGWTLLLVLIHSISYPRI